MAARKLAGRSPGKKKAPGVKKAIPKKRPLQRRKKPPSRAPRKARSAQIHQGVGPLAQGQSEVSAEIPNDAIEYGGES
jgi:hypothetical protein